MLRLLGILSLGNLLLGRRHHRRALRRGVLLGALLGYLANRDFDMNRVQEDVRETARTGELSGKPGKRRGKSKRQRQAAGKFMRCRNAIPGKQRKSGTWRKIWKGTHGRPRWLRTCR